MRPAGAVPITFRRRRFRRFGGSGVLVAGLVAAVVLVAALVTTFATPSGTVTGPSRFYLTQSISPLPSEIGLRDGWNGSAFINDNLWTENDLQFAVWVDGAGNPIVGQRSSAEPAWRTFNLGTLPGNPLGAPTVADAHNVYSVGVDERGYIHVAGNMHSSRLRYLRSLEPSDITAWIRPEMVGSDEDAVSYPAFARIPGGALLFFSRDGAAGRGDVLLNRLDVSTGSWRRIGKLIDGRSSDESPYLQRVAVDAVRHTVHVMFLWRAGSDETSNRDVSYLRSDDGGSTWLGADDAAVPLPVTHETANVVARTGKGGPVLLNQGALAVDEAGRPHGLFRAAGPRSDAIHVWQEPGGGWQTEPVAGTAAMSGRPALVGAGRQPLLMLWLVRENDDQAELRVARLSGRAATGHVVLARMPVTRWEPTFDSAAVERDDLRMLLPVRPSGPRPSRADAAVVTWSVPTLTAA